MLAFLSDPCGSRAVQNAKDCNVVFEAWLTISTAYYIAFGAHGPRAQEPPGEGWRVASYTALGVGVSFVLFATVRFFAKGSPGTMNKEYQEATNEYLKVCLFSTLCCHVIFGR